MQKLPIGIQHFDRIREQNFVYVDKTEQIYTLINTGTFVFLSRPRRFGKSVLLTTLQHLFLGHRQLFQGLWIEDKVDWQPRPVLLINFNDLSYHEKNLADALDEEMVSQAAVHGLTLTGSDYKRKFQELIVKLSEQQKLILLIDEYDKPITDLLEDEQKVAEHISILKDFYSVLKATASNHIQWSLITGVSKYGKISLFSDLNNLLDITMDRRFATVVGYTQAELEQYFGDRIDALAAYFAVSRAEILAATRRWYNGFSWDGKQTLYVPFSTLVFLEQQTFENHWFVTATPSFLLKLFRQNQLPAYILERLRGDNTLLDNADVNNINVISLLFQTGYLTVKQVHPSLQGQRYDLGYPNYEVAQAFQKYLLADYLNISTTQVGAMMLVDLEEALNREDLPRVVLIVNAALAGIPYNLFLPEEAYYHSIFYLLLKLLGFAILAEPHTSQGRIDALLELPDKIYILEFKMSSAQVALDQIKNRHYDQPYRASGKKIILVGIAFDKEKRAIGDWKSEPASTVAAT
jgi:hypothetical protein